MAPLELQLLGGFSARTAGGPSLEIPPRKARAVLAYLALSLGKPMPRERLASLIWGDISQDEQARRSLRQALTTLRRSLPEGALRADRDSIQLHPGAEVDVVRFERLAGEVDRPSLEAAMTLYRGELLEGFSSRAEGFDEWVHRERRRVRSLALGALERLAALQEREGAIEVAMESAMRLVAMDPLRESGHRLLMRLFAESGRTSEALRQFKSLRELLRDELHAEPDPGTLALVERLQAGLEPRAPAPAPAAPAAAALPTGAELRHVCALAAIPAEHVRPAGLVARIARCLEAFGAAIIKHTPELWLGVFGSARSTGAEAECAVRAGLALARELEGGVRVGVASGPVWLDPSDSAPRGDVLRQAIELCEAAGEGVVVSVAMARARGPRLRLEPAAAALLDEARGARALPEAATSATHAGHARAQGQRVLEWLAATEALEDAPFVGRDYELAQLELALELAARSRRGRGFIVRGEAGIGKTRLVAQLSARARALGFSVHARSIVDFGGAEEPVSSLVRELLGGRDGDPLTMLSRAVAAGSLPSDDMPLILDVLGALPSGVRDLEPASREQHLRRRREAVVRVLEVQAARSPRLLWIDDVHWADRALLAQVAAWMALASRAPLVAVITTRVDGQPEGADFWGALRGCPVTTIDLAPLSSDEARTLAHEISGARESSQIDLAIQRAGGNPLFLEQLLRSGDLESVPGTIQSLIQARLDRLDARARYTVAAAAVLGLRFSLEALAHLLGGEAPDLAPLVAQALIVRESPDPRFAHDLVRDGVYASLIEERRVELHRLAASHYAGRDLTLRARHLDRAGAAEAPRAYAEAAAAEHRSGNLELCEALSARGFELSTTAADRFELAQQWGDVSCALGRLEQALLVFEKARHSAPDAVSAARAWVGTAAALRLLDRPHEALAALAQAERRIDPLRHPALMSSVHYLRGSVIFPLGDAPACLRWHTLALEAAQVARSPLAEARALSGIADAHYSSGHFATARVWFERCERRAREAGALELELTSQGMRAITELIDGDLRASRAACISIAERCRTAGATRGEALMQTAVSWASLLLGQWQTALEHASRAVELAARIGARRFEALGLSYIVLARLELEVAPDIGKELERARELAEASGIGFAGGAVYAACVSAERDPERLRLLFESADRMLEASVINVSLVMFVYRGTLAALRLRDYERARRYAGLLESSCGGDPRQLGSLFASFGRCLADWESGARGAALERELKDLRERLAARELRPALEVLDAARARAG